MARSGPEHPVTGPERLSCGAAAFFVFSAASAGTGFIAADFCGAARVGRRLVLCAGVHFAPKFFAVFTNGKYALGKHAVQGCLPILFSNLFQALIIKERLTGFRLCCSVNDGNGLT